jgi:hypothetical protein
MVLTGATTMNGSEGGRRGSAAWQLLALAAMAFGIAALMRPGAVRAAAIVLTQADNNSTVNVSVGDTVTLRLGTDLDWSNSVSVSDMTVLRALPVALARGVQGVWSAAASGQATVSATGRPICAPAQACPLFLATFSATVIVGGGPPPPPGGFIYQPGWNIVGGPDGTTFPVTLYLWDPGRRQYATLPPNTPVEHGRGYWAYFNQSTSVLPAPDSSTSMPNEPGNQFVLIANPSGTQCAGINIGPPLPPGSSRATIVTVVYTYDPTQGMYSGGTGALLKPGQGAWAVLDRSGVIPLVLAGAPGVDGNCIAPP